MKTLKDLDVIDMHERKVMINQVVSIEELKAEAIKWVKHWERMKKALIPEASNYLEIYHRIEGKIVGVRHFINITSEDLK